MVRSGIVIGCLLAVLHYLHLQEGEGGKVVYFSEVPSPENKAIVWLLRAHHANVQDLIEAAAIHLHTDAP
jgi:hypothetical protein